jgi:hypothetical protein
MRGEIAPGMRNRLLFLVTRCTTACALEGKYADESPSSPLHARRPSRAGVFRNFTGKPVRVIDSQGHAGHENFPQTSPQILLRIYGD